MYKIYARKSVEGTLRYFLGDKELSAQEKSGVWVGRAAKALGLIPSTETERTEVLNVLKPVAKCGINVTKTDLEYALYGYAPPTQSGTRPLNARYMPVGVRRCAWDIVLGAHKSVSVAALCLRDKNPTEAQLVRSAYDVATMETFQAMECLARRNGGRGPDVETFAGGDQLSVDCWMARL